SRLRYGSARARVRADQHHDDRAREAPRRTGAHALGTAHRPGVGDGLRRSTERPSPDHGHVPGTPDEHVLQPRVPVLHERGWRLMAKPPILDGRTADQVLSALLARAPGYTPGWQPASGTAANAILSVFSRTVAIEGTALDAMPDRSRLSFLDTLGNSLLPAQPARAPLVFTLMDSAPLDVSLPAGTQVAASLPPATPATPGAANPPADAPLYF